MGRCPRPCDCAERHGHQPDRFGAHDLDGHRTYGLLTRRLRPAAWFALAAAVVLLTTAFVASGRQHSRGDGAGQAPSLHAQWRSTTLALNPRDVAAVVSRGAASALVATRAASADGNRFRVEILSLDAGTPPRALTRATFAGRPEIALAADGSAIAAWSTDVGATGAAPTLSAAYRPSDGAWSSPQDLGSGPENSVAQVAVDAVGHAIVSWGNDDDARSQTFHARAATRNRDGRWTECGATLPTDIAGSLTPSYLDDSGTAVMTSSEGFGSVLRPDCSFSVPVRFAGPVVAAPDGLGSAVLLARADADGALLARDVSASGAPSPATRLAAGRPTVQRTAAIAVDGHHTSFAAWSDVPCEFVDRAVGAPTRIHYATRRSGGSWRIASVPVAPFPSPTNTAAGRRLTPRERRSFLQLPRMWKVTGVLPLIDGALVVLAGEGDYGTKIVTLTIASSGAVSAPQVVAKNTSAFTLPSTVNTPPAAAAAGTALLLGMRVPVVGEHVRLGSGDPITSFAAFYG